MPNQFFWYDLVTTDTAAAAKFYGDVVGWTYEDMSQPGNAYGIFKVGDVGVAGLMPFPQGMQGHPGWNGYIAVDDVDAAADQIKALGGAIHRGPIEVPGIIKFAVAGDPQGAVFIVAKGLSSTPRPELPTGTPGTIGWRELFATDWQSDFDFYSKLFGWTKAEAHDMGEAGIYQLFAAGGHPIGGMMNRPAVMSMSWWNYYTNVESIDAAVARIEKAGGSIKMGPMEVPGGQWVVQAQDPQGAFFALVAPKR
ncbi:MAG TPA: VOC family protein [Rhizomicrobium sp.]|nr:VOC family protein [Rhizomicrobium sp.]